MIPQAVTILFGAAFTVVTATAIGRTLLRRTGAALDAGEERLLGFVCGSAVLSLLVFLAAAAHILHKGVLVTIGAAALIFAYRFGAYRFGGQRTALVFTPVPRLWRWIFGLGFGTFTILYFFNAMAPECSADGVSYHLSFVAQYLRAHRLVFIPDNMYAQLSQGIEMLFVFAFAFGRHSAAAMVHYAFLVALSLLILSYCRRIQKTAVGVTAALLVYACPVAGMDGTSAYIDVATACIVFSFFYLVQIWDADRNAALLPLIGLLAGFAYAAKYTAFLAVPYAVGYIFWRSRKLLPPALVAACSLILIAPWVLKNAIWAGNPFSPLMNSWFPNPTVHIDLERIWLEHLRTYYLPNLWPVPLELTIHGDKLTGMIGPAFLLIPVAFLAMRTPIGRVLLVPAVLFTIPYFANIGARFTLTALPFWSIALALALASFPPVLAAIAVLHCILCWPSVLRLYASKYVWALDRIPFKQALRIEDQETWLRRRHPDYEVARVIELNTPAGAKILSFDGRAEAYTSRHIAVAFQSARTQVLEEIFFAAFEPDYQATLVHDVRFAPVRARKIRLVQTAQSRDNDEWAITELRVLQQGVELPRSPAWRLSARPNPWDVQLAFDNSPVTRWKTWEPFRPGMYVEVDFGSTQSIDEVRVEGNSSKSPVRLRLEYMDDRGVWAAVDSSFSDTEVPAPGFCGKAAFAEIKARGYDYVILEVPEYGAAEVGEAPAAWGLVEAARSRNAILYRIDLPGPVLAETKP